MRIQSIRFPRRLVQLGCALAFVAIPFLNRAEISALSGNFLAFNFAGLPLGDPLAALQVALATMSASASMLIGALITLAIAFLLGPVFCSWLCPYGFLSEIVHRPSLEQGKEERALVPNSPVLPVEAKKQTKGAPFSASPFFVRLCIVAVGLLLAATLVPFPVLNQLSMPGWYSRSLQHVPLDNGMLWGGLIFLAGMLLLEFALRKRLWCRYLCPQSVLISLAGMLLPKRLQIAFTRKRCTCAANDRVCGKACSLALDPRHPERAAQKAQCTNCGDCVDACRERGRALTMRFGKG